jgi:hypothetical protein
MLDEIQDSMFQRAKAERDSRMKQAFDFEGTSFQTAAATFTHWMLAKELEGSSSSSSSLVCYHP